MSIESCRDCANFEDRRNIEGVALCAIHRGPSVCCPEFNPKGEKINARKLYDKFCLNCVNFENVDGIAVCARDHRPGIACSGFRSKSARRSQKKLKQFPMSTVV